VRHRRQFSDGELGQQGDTGGAEDIGKRLDAFPVAAPDLLEVGDPLGVNADQLEFKGAQERAGAQETVEWHVQQAGRFPADLDADVVTLRGGVGNNLPM